MRRAAARSCAECFIKEFLGKELIVYLSKGDFAGTVKRICESELRLPNPNEVLSKYYKRSFALPAVECVAKCFAKQIPYVGSIISDSITIEANYIILSASSFKCNNIKREINFLLKYRVIIHVKMNSKNVYTENLGYETNYKRLGLVPWCRCCQ